MICPGMLLLNTQFTKVNIASAPTLKTPPTQAAEFSEKVESLTVVVESELYSAPVMDSAEFFENTHLISVSEEFWLYMPPPVQVFPPLVIVNLSSVAGFHSIWRCGVRQFLSELGEHTQTRQ